MTKKNTITIVVASDNHYAILVAALLKSIDVNHKTAEHIDFYIVDDGISAKSKERLDTIADPERITVKWIKSKDTVPPDITLPIDNSAFPLTVYMRIFSPYIVDQSLEKIIYLDVDTIVVDDISNLWAVDLGDHIIAAAQDPGKTVDFAWAGIPNYLELGLTKDTKYFNSGVLIINPVKWRENDISNQVISALVTYKKYVRMADQYGLNVVFANKWLQLDPKFNWFAHELSDHPSIIHFLDIKPIFKSYKGEAIYKEKFFNYLEQTPWKNQKPVGTYQRFLKKISTKIKKLFLKLK